jgi:hypothetical protein
LNIIPTGSWPTSVSLASRTIWGVGVWKKDPEGGTFHWHCGPSPPALGQCNNI